MIMFCKIYIVNVPHIQFLSLVSLPSLFWSFFLLLDFFFLFLLLLSIICTSEFIFVDFQEYFLFVWLLCSFLCVCVFNTLLRNQIIVCQSFAPSIFFNNYGLIILFSKIKFLIRNNVLLFKLLETFLFCFEKYQFILITKLWNCTNSNLNY